MSRATAAPFRIRDLGKPKTRMSNHELPRPVDSNFEAARWDYMEDVVVGGTEGRAREEVEEGRSKTSRSITRVRVFEKRPTTQTTPRTEHAERKRWTDGPRSSRVSVGDGNDTDREGRTAATAATAAEAGSAE